MEKSQEEYRKMYEQEKAAHEQSKELLRIAEELNEDLNKQIEKLKTTDES